MKALSFSEVTAAAVNAINIHSSLISIDQAVNKLQNSNPHYKNELL